MSFLAASTTLLRLGATCRARCIPLDRWRRTFATKYTDCRNGYISLERIAESRRAQARRSVLVQVGSEASCGELVAYCEHFGGVTGVHHYTLSGGEQHFMLVEFNEESEVNNILDTGSYHRKDVDVIPIRTPFLWFKAANGKKAAQSNFVLTTRNGCDVISDEALFEELQSCKSISEQIERLYQRIALNDLGIRLRYMVARQVEMAFENLYANIAVRPFGSSVNGFGKMGCDLDLVLTNFLEDDLKSTENRLVFHTKKSAADGAAQWRRHLELAGDVLQLCVPGCARVRRILQARIPIIKYTHDYTGTECDLAATNMSAVHMSELLYVYGSWDARVRPLVLAVRRWAAAAGLTSPSPGRWITNFPLTLMVLFYLQQDTKGGPVLPPMKYLVEKAGKEDIRITEDKINCTFLRDLNKIPSNDYSSNESDLETLLLQFFEFYSQFDFEQKAISINEGRPIRKPNHTALYIVNPLEPALNVSRNVSFEECEKLKTEVRNAAWKLESNLEGDRGKLWGLMELFEAKSRRSIKELVRVGNSHRLVTVSDLFKEDTSEQSVPLEFKNRQVQNQVKKLQLEKNAVLEQARRKVALETSSDVKVRQRTVRKR